MVDVVGVFEERGGVTVECDAVDVCDAVDMCDVADVYDGDEGGVDVCDEVELGVGVASISVGNGGCGECQWCE